MNATKGGQTFIIDILICKYSRSDPDAFINLDKIVSICEAWPRNQPSVNHLQRVAMIKSPRPHFSKERGGVFYFF
jgi:hypothetical protein